MALTAPRRVARSSRNRGRNASRPRFLRSVAAAMCSCFGFVRTQCHAGLSIWTSIFIRGWINIKCAIGFLRDNRKLLALKKGDLQLLRASCKNGLLWLEKKNLCGRKRCAAGVTVITTVAKPSADTTVTAGGKIKKSRGPPKQPA